MTSLHTTAEPKSEAPVQPTMSEYGGYLKPHEAKIRQLAQEGKTPRQIGRILYADGVRSPNDAIGHRVDHARSLTGLIRYILKPREKPPERRRAEPVINPNYNGYLKPHLDKIERLAREGMSPRQIGRILYEDGIRSPYDTGLPDANGYLMDSARAFTGLIYVILGLRRGRPRRQPIT